MDKFLACPRLLIYIGIETTYPEEIFTRLILARKPSLCTRAFQFFRLLIWRQGQKKPLDKN